MTWLWFVNFFLFQWFGLRLARVLENDGSQSGWTWLTKIVPLTGWWSKYKRF